MAKTKEELLEELRQVEEQIDEVSKSNETTTAKDILLRELRYKKFCITRDVSAVTVAEEVKEYNEAYFTKQQEDAENRMVETQVTITGAGDDKLAPTEANLQNYIRALNMCTTYRESLEATATKIDKLMEEKTSEMTVTSSVAASSW